MSTLTVSPSIGRETRGLSIQALTEAGGAGLHNAIPRCKNIGGGLTAAQSAAIRAGTFDDVFVGDYWPIAVPAYSWTDTSNVVHNESATSVVFRVAECDPRLNSGYGSTGGLMTHHMVVVPDTILYTARMNATDTTDGGYMGSEMYTNNLRRAKALFTAAFGSGHILTHRELLTNAVANGRTSAGAWVDSTVELMDERMVYGSLIFDSASPDGSGGTNVHESFYRYTVSKSQLSVFRLRPDLIIAGTGSSRVLWWLRNVVSAACFANVNNNGNCNYNNASNAGSGVRPDSLPAQFADEFPCAGKGKEETSFAPSGCINANRHAAGYDRCSYRAVFFLLFVHERFS